MMMKTQPPETPDSEVFDPGALVGPGGRVGPGGGVGPGDGVGPGGAGPPPLHACFDETVIIKVHVSELSCSPVNSPKVSTLLSHIRFSFVSRGFPRQLSPFLKCNVKPSPPTWFSRGPAVAPWPFSHFANTSQQTCELPGSPPSW